MSIEDLKKAMENQGKELADKIADEIEARRSSSDDQPQKPEDPGRCPHGVLNYQECYHCEVTDSRHSSAESKPDATPRGWKKTEHFEQTQFGPRKTGETIEHIERLPCSNCDALRLRVAELLERSDMHFEIDRLNDEAFELTTRNFNLRTELVAAKAERDDARAELKMLRESHKRAKDEISRKDQILNSMALAAEFGDGKHIANQLMSLQIDEANKRSEHYREKLTQANAEIERLNVQLAGCGVAAMANTEESMKKHLIEKGSYGWSQSYQDIVDVVKREISANAETEKWKERALWADRERDMRGLEIDTLNARIKELEQTVEAYQKERYPFSAGAMVRREQKLVAALLEVDRLLEGLTSGREIGTDMKKAGTNAKYYAWQIQMEIAAALIAHKGGK